MKLTLTWKNLNPPGAKISIYRGDAPLVSSALPEPLVTLNDGEETWVDNNVVYGKQYYYMFVTVNANDQVASRNYPIKAYPRRGHGPVELIYGDNDLGYFGSVESVDFTNTFDILKAIGFSSLGAQSKIKPGRDFPVWHKFVRQGKILLIPDGTLSANGTSNEFIQRGAWFGMDTVGPQYIIGHTAIQNAKIKIGPDTYRIRAPRGDVNNINDPITNTAKNIVPGDPAAKSEFDECVATIVQYISPTQKLPNVDTKTPALFGMGGTTTGICCMEGGAGKVLTRGGYVTNSAAISYYQSNTTSYDNTCYWLPILELIEE